MAGRVVARAILAPLLLPGPAGGLVAWSAGEDPYHAYYWPEGRGNPSHYSSSSYAGPKDLTTGPAWTWSRPGGDNSTWSSPTHTGCNVDDEKNIYLASSDGIRKFSPTGRQSWQVRIESTRLPTLYDGAVYVTDNNGAVTALSMDDGHRIFERKFTEELGGDISGVGVWAGVVVACSRGNRSGGAASVSGLNARDGRPLWELKVDAQLWNFMPMYTGNHSFIFQDQTGGVYHVNLQDGSLLWKSGYNDGWDRHFTNGMPTVRDGIVYAVHSEGKKVHANQRANLRAYSLKDGHVLWMHMFSHPVNSQPAVGYLSSGGKLSKKLSVVIPVGAQPTGDKANYESSVVALDAKTGVLQWEWKPDVWTAAFARGEEIRGRHNSTCRPNSFGSPSIDSSGTIYLGHYNGFVYSIRDKDADGKIGDGEDVSRFDAGDAFVHSGAALADGMLAIPSCQTLYVFKSPTPL